MEDNLDNTEQQKTDDNTFVKVEPLVIQKPPIPKVCCVKPIKPDETYEWLLKKHYAHRIPSISYSFGLYINDLEGVCTFGMPPNYMEMKAWQPFELLELNRLVINDGLDRNTLSFFVANCLRLLPQPKVVISYSDFRAGHHGYIYQATNWVYTGVGGEGQNIYIMKDGTERHQRHEDKINMELVDHVEKTTGKARYYFFIGNKKTVKEMNDKLRFKRLPYPKGANQRYDVSYKPNTQQTLF
jgi:hypothetical protein